MPSDAAGLDAVREAAEARLSEVKAELAEHEARIAPLVAERDKLIDVLSVLSADRGSASVPVAPTRPTRNGRRNRSRAEVKEMIVPFLRAQGGSEIQARIKDHVGAANKTTKEALHELESDGSIKRESDGRSVRWRLS